MWSDFKPPYSVDPYSEVKEIIEYLFVDFGMKAQKLPCDDTSFEKDGTHYDCAFPIQLTDLSKKYASKIGTVLSTIDDILSILYLAEDEGRECPREEIDKEKEQLMQELFDK